MAKEGYIFMFQDIRGKYRSERTMQIHQPLIHATQKGLQESDFIRATQTIYFSNQYPTRIDLPVMTE